MKLYRKMIRFYVCDYCGQGFAASIHYTSDWLYEDDPEVEQLVKENEQIAKEDPFLERECEVKYVPVEGGYYLVE